jgi:hypothetical protein
LLRTPYTLVNKDGYLFAMLCGCPKDEGWGGVNSQVADALLKAKDKVWSEGCQRRGAFTNASTGVTLGQGATVGLIAFAMAGMLTRGTAAVPWQQPQPKGNTRRGGGPLSQ